MNIVKMETRLKQSISSEVILQQPKSEKFDFQSSYARSLAFNSGSGQSVDFALSFRFGNGSDTSMASASFVSESTEQSPVKSSIFLPENQQETNNQQPPKLPSTPPPPCPMKNSNRSMDICGLPATNTCLPQDLPSVMKNGHSSSKPVAAEIEVLRLRKECQSLIEDNRRLMKTKAEHELNHMNGNDNNNVETVILQSQVESLQWQLKQVESSRQMYHAVLEEVARFLERCHQSLDLIQKDQMSRPKNQSSPNGYGHQSTENIARLRTSTNSMDHSNGLDQSVVSSVPSVGSYSTFRDFTWRRSPKRTSQYTVNDSLEFDPEKLSQEAFRLLRTTQNLINLKEPVLSDAKFPPRYGFDLKNNMCTSTLQRKLNTRESRLSIQSSTDDSVHSTSSSRTETDEETQHPPIPFSSISSAVLMRKHLVKSVASSVDDESGFSSMNSFQEIGLPLLPSTSASSTISSDKSDDSAEDTTIVENKKPMCNTKGELAAKSLTIDHRRWSSAPPLPPKRSLTPFSTHSGDETLKVLWV